MGSLRSHLILAAGVVAVLALQKPGTVDAQPVQEEQAPSSVDKQAAKRLVDAGIAAQSANEYDTAIELYNKAFALVPHPLLLFNIGQAHRLSGRLAHAVPFYERYLALDPHGPESTVARTILAGFYFNLALAQLKRSQEIEARENLVNALRHGEEPLGTEQFKEAQKQLQELERQLGRIRITCQTEGAEVALDGVKLFTGPGSYQGWVKAKDYELTAKKVGHLSQTKRVAVAPGAAQHVELRLITLSEPSDSHRRWSAWKPWMVVAAGSAIMVIGSTLHLDAFRNFRRFDQNLFALECARRFVTPEIIAGCSVDDPNLIELTNHLDYARRQQAIAVGSYIIGSSLIAAGAVLLYMNQPRSVGWKSVDSKNMAILPKVSSNLLGIQIGVSF